MFWRKKEVIEKRWLSCDEKGNQEVWFEKPFFFSFGPKQGFFMAEDGSELGAKAENCDILLNRFLMPAKSRVEITLVAERNKPVRVEIGQHDKF